MSRKISVLAAMIFFMAAYPATAMMGGGRMMHKGESEGGSSGPSVVSEEKGTGHSHGDYYHRHEGGEVPHSHNEKGEIVKQAAWEEGKEQNSSPSDDKAREADQAVSSHEGHEEMPASQPLKDEAVEPQGVSEEESARDKASSEVVAQSPDSEQTIQGRDDMVLHLVPGGKLTLPENPEREEPGESVVDVKSFYMDETQVTNHQYVEFLNQALPKLTVENGVVRKDGNIWLFLGEVREGYDPIVFKDGRFIVNGVHHAACPVLRVTAYGASAYAQFYGKRLPAEAEWLHAAKAGDAKDPASLPIPTPVVGYPANKYGIRGLNASVAEWGVKSMSSSSDADKEDKEYVLLGGLSDSGDRQSVLSSGVRRYPWEAFGDAGFRCVVNAVTERE